VPTDDVEELLARAQGGSRRALGRLLSIVEQGGGKARHLARLAFAWSERTELVVGVTGAPGAGKSTLVSRLVAEARRDAPVAVLAVDPSSPCSGGALLGDRVRMADHAGDPGVFIRSMASRGNLGGLSSAVREAIRVLVAAGYQRVLVETVGVGQVEIDVVGAADTTVVVVNPGWGDSVQAAKAGLLEVADVLVVNKADRPGAAGARRDLETMLDLDPDPGGWRPPVLLTDSLGGVGTAELWKAIGEHRSWLEGTGELGSRRRRRLLDELEALLVQRIETRVRTVAAGARWQEVTGEMLALRLDPASAAEALLADVDPDVGPADPAG
jgi:LAO/AO transport system kinase